MVLSVSLSRTFFYPLNYTGVKKIKKIRHIWDIEEKTQRVHENKSQRFRNCAKTTFKQRNLNF